MFAKFFGLGAGAFFVEVSNENEAALVDQAACDFSTEALRAARYDGNPSGDLAFTAFTCFGDLEDVVSASDGDR